MLRPNETIKYRVRLVACGYSQILGKDFDETYAPTAKYRSLCMILNLAAIFDWEIEGIDVEQAFLESPLDKEIYMTLPKDVYCQSNNSNNPAIVKLLRSLYGLNQAGELWYKTVKEILRNKVQTVQQIKNAPAQHHQRSLLQILTYHTTPCQQS